MNKHEASILIKSTLIVTVTTAFILWSKHNPQLSISALFGYIMICWAYVVYVISIDDIFDKKWKFALHPLTQVAVWLISLIGIWLATEGGRVVDTLPAPWIIIGIIFTLASKEGWKWILRKIAVNYG